jgi:nitric oxide reductase subunit B
MADASLAHPSDDPVADVLKWLLLATAVACFGLLGWATVKTYQFAPPLPAAIVGSDGAPLMTGDDLIAGKAGFQKADLMDYGSIYGMGSYFGEDYTASTLVKLGTETRNNVALAKYGQPFERLSPEQQFAATEQMRAELQQLNLAEPKPVAPPALTAAIHTVRSNLAAYLHTVDAPRGWTPARALSTEAAARTADFIVYAALTTVARRPGMTSSWTENWPFEPLVGNTPTTNTFRWTWMSFCFTFFCFGAVLFIYQTWLNTPDDAPKVCSLGQFRPLTPSQRRIGKYFVVVSLILLGAIGVGSMMAHSYYDRQTFYGLQLNAILPFNFMRSFHTQAPIAWIGLAWIGSGLFLAPAIAGGHEAPRQAVLVELLFWVTLAVVAGAFVGNYLGIIGVIDRGWFWIGNQGLSYIQLGRFWQIGFFLGLAFWCYLVFRALWPSYDKLWEATKQFWTGRIRLEHLIWASTANIAILYVCGMIPLTGIGRSFTLTDFWRWWVVHLWVEQSFEFFAVAMSAYLLMALGLVSRKLAERSVYFELILIFLGGVLGTGHHLYWAGGPRMWVPLGSMFSFIEVLPLVLLILEAIAQHRLIRDQASFHYNVAYTYILGSAFWNFVGAGVFGGGTLNAPLINYYEHGTFLTLNHAHTALFGAFGQLGLGLIYFCLRYRAGEKAQFSEWPGLAAFWLYNAGLVLWVLLNFFPIGWPQLDAVFEHGLAYARSNAFYKTTLLWQWMRLPGDIVFAAGALLMAWDFLVKLMPPRKERAAQAAGGAPQAVG